MTISIPVDELVSLLKRPSIALTTEDLYGIAPVAARAAHQRFPDLVVTKAVIALLEEGVEKVQPAFMREVLKVLWALPSYGHLESISGREIRASQVWDEAFKAVHWDERRLFPGLQPRSPNTLRSSKARVRIARLLCEGVAQLEELAEEPVPRALAQIPRELTDSRLRQEFENVLVLASGLVHELVENWPANGYSPLGDGYDVNGDLLDELPSHDLYLRWKSIEFFEAKVDALAAMMPRIPAAFQTQRTIFHLKRALRAYRDGLGEDVSGHRLNEEYWARTGGEGPAPEDAYAHLGLSLDSIERRRFAQVPEVRGWCEDLYRVADEIWGSELAGAPLDEEDRLKAADIARQEKRIRVSWEISALP